MSTRLLLVPPATAALAASGAVTLAAPAGAAPAATGGPELVAAHPSWWPASRAVLDPHRTDDHAGTELGRVAPNVDRVTPGGLLPPGRLINADYLPDNGGRSALIMGATHQGVSPDRA